MEEPTRSSQRGNGDAADAATVPASLLRQALDHVTDAVAIFDEDWAIRYVNGAAAVVLGRPETELVGRNYFTVFPDAAGTAYHGFLLRVRADGGPTSWRGFYARTSRWYTATAQVLGDGSLHLSFRQDPPKATGVNDNAGERRPDEIADRERLRFLGHVSEALTATHDTLETAKRLTELVVPRLADWSLVVLQEEDGRRSQAWTHGEPSAQADLDVYLNGRLPNARVEELFEEVLRSGSPIQVLDAGDTDGPDSLPTATVQDAHARLGSSSFVVVPLRARGDVFGVLALVNTGSRTPHTELEIAAATEVARRGAMALDNARLYHQQRHVAETLQRSHLAPPPHVDGLEIAVRYRPASRHQQVGGDWYDAFVHPDGATSLVIGDVAGHNLDAAAAMGQVRSIVRAIASDHPGSPAQTLTRVERVLTQLDVGTLATAVLARIEPADETSEGRRTLRWSSAGHPAPVVLCPDGTVRVLDHPSDLLLGTGLPDSRATHETWLDPGDTVLLYTDGLVEVDRTDIDTGTARLTTALGGLAARPVDEMCGRLLDLLAPGRTQDDIALVAVRVESADLPVADGQREDLRLRPVRPVRPVEDPAAPLAPAAGRRGWTTRTRAEDTSRSPTTRKDSPTGFQTGDHVCWTFADSRDFAATVTAYLDEGRRRGEQLLLTGPPTVDLAEALESLPERDAMLASGQLGLLSTDDLYTSEKGLDPDGQVAAFRAAGAEAVSRGYTGLRVAADITALAGGSADRRRELHVYERMVDTLIAGAPLTGMCLYDGDLDPDVLGPLLALHHFQRHGDRQPLAHLSGEDGRLSLHGELDGAHGRDVCSALFDLASQTTGEVVLDLSELEFLDVAGAEHLVRTTARLADIGVRLELVHAPPAVSHVLALFPPPVERAAP